MDSGIKDGAVADMNRFSSSFPLIKSFFFLYKHIDNLRIKQDMA
jgi:hypothetical protein